MTPVLVASSEGLEVENMAPALWTHRGPAPVMPHSHRHDDLELNFILSGRLDYLYGGSHISIPEGNIALFWGATPHRLVEGSDSRLGDIGWIHIPLTTVLSWGLSDQDRSDILSHRPIIVPATAVGQQVASMLERWARDADGDDDMRAISLLEAQAVIRRLLRFARERSSDGHDSPSPSPSLDEGVRHAAAMAQYLAANFRRPITPADITEAVHLNPRYAMTLFRRAVGMTIGAYLTRCRVAEARRLLLTTSMTTSEIAHSAGFGSQSSLYAHFGRESGMSPGAYRRRH